MLVYVTAIAGAAALNTMSVLDTMCKSNDAWRALGDPSADDLFTTRACGPGGGPARFDRGVVLDATVDPAADPVPDLVVVPGLDDDVPTSMAVNAGWIEPLRRWHEAGAVVAASCTGTFLLAEAGLLTGRRAATHWVAAPALAARYPDIKVHTEAVVVDEGDVITSGGATTAFNLVLYLISRFGGRERANAATRLMLLDSGRSSQQPFALTAIHRDHDDEVVHRAQAALQGDSLTLPTVASLASAVGVSQRTLTRRFRSALGITPQNYLEEVRINAACRILEETSRGIEDVGAEIGFRDGSSFRRAFKRQTGLSPAGYRRRYATPESLIGR